MNKKRKPLKPDRPLASIVFPKHGKPRRSIEHLPRTQDKLEFAVGEKFVGSLVHFFGRKYSDLKSGPGRGDLLCHDEHGLLLRIQVVEVIDQNLRQLTEMRNDYADYVRAECGEIFEAYRGCAVTLVDVGDSPYLPNIRTREGRDCASQLTQWLSDLGKDIESLESKKIRIRRTTLVPYQREISVMIERFLPYDNDAPVAFRWSGGGPSYQVDKPRNLLPTAIAGKINKNYSKPKGPFWLLAYSTDTLYREEDPDIQESSSLLEKTDHPFDEVWYFYPYNNVKLGHLIHVWPTT